MSYQMQIDPKSRKAARFISRLQKTIQKTLIASGMTQQQVAEVLEVDRSVINRRLKGNANLTARSIAEFAYAFDKDVEIRFVGRSVSEQSNTPSATNVVIDLNNHRGPSSTVSTRRNYSIVSAAL